MNPWIQTRDGHAVSLVEPDLSEVTIYELAHSLARINRFTGHTRGPIPYTVAQHSVLVAQHCSPKAAYAGLCHDLHESLCGDITSPVKRALANEARYDGVHEVEVRLMRAVMSRFDVPLTDEIAANVYREDMRALVTERRDLMGNVQAWPWDVDEAAYPAWVELIVPWGIAEAEARFLEAFWMLGKVGEKA